MNHRALTAGCLAWAVLGLAIAAAGLGSVNPDARLLVFSATAIGGSAALSAAWLAARGHIRWAGLCLVVSVIIPTWFAAWLNLIPLAAGTALLWVGDGPAGSRSGDPPPPGRAARCSPSTDSEEASPEDVDIGEPEAGVQKRAR